MMTLRFPAAGQEAGRAAGRLIERVDDDMIRKVPAEPVPADTLPAGALPGDPSPKVAP